MNINGWLCIENEGEVENNAFVLLGASTKRGQQNKIGRFGSGACFAVAWLMRNGTPFRVFSGEREIIFSYQTTTLGTETFKQIIIDGHTTSLTTDAGPEWEEWMAVREIYCNAIDAGGDVLVRNISPQNIRGKAGVTRVYILETHIRDTLNKFNEYFLTNRLPIFNLPDVGSIYLPADKNIGKIYRQGIRVGDSVRRYVGMYITYDIDLFNSDINESRELTYSPENDRQFWRLFAACDQEQVIRHMISMFSTHGHLPYLDDLEFSGEWAGLIGRLVLYLPHEVPILTADELSIGVCASREMIEFLQRSNLSGVINRPARTFDEHEEYVQGEFTEMQRGRLEKILNTLRERADINVPIDKFHLGEFFEKGILGMYATQKDRIVIGQRAFDRGNSDLMVTVLEEVLHRNTGSKDFTREFQDAILQLCVKLIEAS